MCIVNPDGKGSNRSSSTSGRSLMNNLMWLRMPCLRVYVSENERPVQSLPKLIGFNSDNKKFKTPQAKEYPARLCQLIPTTLMMTHDWARRCNPVTASMHFGWVLTCQRLVTPLTEDGPADFGADFAQSSHLLKPLHYFTFAESVGVRASCNDQTTKELSGCT